MRSTAELLIVRSLLSEEAGHQLFSGPAAAEFAEHRSFAEDQDAIHELDQLVDFAGEHDHAHAVGQFPQQA